MIALHDLSANNSKPYLIFFGPRHSTRHRRIVLSHRLRSLTPNSVHSQLKL
jgi:hypothetical protein